MSDNTRTEMTFSEAIEYFEKYPMGKCISSIDGEILLEVMHLTSARQQHADFVLLTTSETPDGTMCMVIFEEIMYPGLTWEFMRSDGTRVIEIADTFREFIPGEDNESA